MEVTIGWDSIGRRTACCAVRRQHFWLVAIKGTDVNTWRSIHTWTCIGSYYGLVLNREHVGAAVSRKCSSVPAAVVVAAAFSRRHTPGLQGFCRLHYVISTAAHFDVDNVMWTIQSVLLFTPWLFLLMFQTTFHSREFTQTRFFLSRSCHTCSVYLDFTMEIIF